MKKLILSLFTALFVLSLPVFALENEKTQYTPFTLVEIEGKTMYVNEKGVPETGVYGFHKEKHKHIYITKDGKVKDFVWSYGSCFSKDFKYKYKNTITPDGYKVDKVGNIVGHINGITVNPENAQKEAMYKALEEDIRKEFDKMYSDYRAKNNLPKVDLDVRIKPASDIRAKEISTKGFYRHKRPDGRSFSSAITDTLGSYKNYSSEIIYMVGTENTDLMTAKDMASYLLSGWIKSASHNESLLEPLAKTYYISFYPGLNAGYNDNCMFYSSVLFLG